MASFPDKSKRFILACATTSVTVAVCLYAPSLRRWVRRRLLCGGETKLGQSDLELDLSNCVERGPALLAKHGVIKVANAIVGAELGRAQQKARTNFEEVLAARLRRLNVEGLGATTWTFKEICCRDGDRFDVQYGMHEEPFATLADDGPWCLLVRSILGEDTRLLYSGLIIACGYDDAEAQDDAEPQDWHMDGDHLFEDENSPCHCLTVFVPLVDMTVDNGSTEFSLGTHIHADHYPDGEIIFECTAGSAIIFDCRLLHRGTANRAASDRPLLYFTYAKPWYKDPINYRRQNSCSSVFS